ncbi:hypothetical protein RUND412_011089 [Rhizina undulata]
MAPSILIVNPNSTARMTDSLKPLVESLPFPNVTYAYFTAPSPAPPSINDTATSDLSASVCLPLLLSLLPNYDGFLIACYSPHPLIPALRTETSRPVIGIFEASITHSLHLLRPGEIFGIVTTGAQWEGILTRAVEEFLGSTNGGGHRFAGVATTGLSAVELHDVGKDIVDARMAEATGKLVARGKLGKARVGVICLGCAGMAGMGEVVEEAANAERESGVEGGKVRIVDGVRAGVGILLGLLSCEY